MILVVDMNWKKGSLAYFEFVSPIVSIAEELDNCTIKHYSEVDNEDLSRCSSIVLSGTPLKDNVTLSQPEKFGWIKQTDKPLLGICAGMQTLGSVFEAALDSCLQIGMTQVSTLKENPLFSGTFKAYTVHRYSVQASAGFEILAESAKCIQAVKHIKKPIYGVLFHPEVRNVQILKRFFQLK
jgi:GMP synthase-like glutamine amidotransferase